MRRALVKVRREVIDLNVGKSTFFALTDPSGVAIRNDLEEDAMAGQNLLALFPALAKATDAYTTGTGSFPTTSASNAPDRDWIAGAPVKRADGSTGEILVTGWSYSGRAQWLQSRIRAVGKLALTNYLSQTVICTTIFYSFGFALYGTLGRPATLLVVLGVWLLQLVVSPLYLKVFRIGPVEWVWRSLSYRRLMPVMNRT